MQDGAAQLGFLVDVAAGFLRGEDALEVAPGRHPIPAELGLAADVQLRLAGPRTAGVRGAVLSEEVARIIKSPAVTENLTAQGADPVGNSPAEFGAFIREETKRYEKVVREAGVTAE